VPSLECQVSATSHDGQLETSPQSSHSTTRVWPRRLRKTSAWSPRASAPAEAVEQRGGEERAVVLRPLVQVDQLDHRQRPAVDALGQAQVPQLAALGVRPRLEARRRRTEHGDRVRQARAHERGVAAVVADLLALLVGGIVLLVDDDQSQRGQGREHRRARADHDVEAALARALPGRAAVADRQRGVQHAHALAEARSERRDHLVRQRNLGHEHERLPARAAAGLGAFQVHLGLAAAGHAVQQEARVRAGAQRVGHRGDGVLLRLRQARALAARDRCGKHGSRRGALARAAAAEALEPAGQGAREHAADGREVVVGDPLAEPQQLGRERRHLADDARDRLHPRAVARLHALDDEAADARARRTGSALRRRARPAGTRCSGTA
jgi:hypothetical protein